jgi:hypothetical protein
LLDHGPNRPFAQALAGFAALRDRSQQPAVILPKMRTSRLKGSVPKLNRPISIEEMNIAIESGATERHRR